VQTAHPELPRRPFPATLWRLYHASGLSIPLLYLAIVALTSTVTNPREFDYDEGVNLIKALLLGRGFSLYSQVWNDQPPLFTALLARWFVWFGQSMAASRILVLLFSALLLWTFYLTVRRTASEAAAVAATAALVLSEQYFRLSTSVMIGLPALALAMLSIYLFMVGIEARRPWLMAASGLALALSLQTKLFTAVVALVLAGYLALDIALRWRQGTRPSFVPALAWSATLGVAFLALGLSLGSLNLDQLLGTHLNSQAQTAYADENNLEPFGQELVRHMPYVLLGLAGTFWAVRRRQRQVILPAAWTVASALALLYQKPWQYHHVLLLTIPLAWLSAYGFDACIAAFAGLGRATRPAIARPAQIGIAALALILVALMIYQPAPLRLRLPDEQPPGIPYNDWVLSRLCPNGSHNRPLVWSDVPYYAFLAGQSMPPELAVVTRKRFESGKLDEEGVLATLQASHPRYVVLERYLVYFSPDFFAQLEKLYLPVATYFWGAQQWPGKFYVARAPTTGDAPAADQAQFGGWLGLTWTPESIPATLSAGDCLGINDLLWSRPEGTRGRDLALSLRLADRNGHVWFQHDEPLGSDWNTLRDRAQLSYVLNPLLPEGMPPGDYTLLMTVYDPGTGQALPVRHGDEAPADRLVLGQVQVQRPAGTSTSRPAVADFGPLRLVEAKTPVSDVSPGHSIPISLLWQAAPDYRPDQYVVVVQLLDPNGTVVAGLEEQPLASFYPTERWQPGEVVLDRHSLGVPANLSPGSYTLITGVYRASDRERLRASSGFLGLSSGDHYTVRNIVVK
jgi:hypothetical protein